MRWFRRKKEGVSENSTAKTNGKNSGIPSIQTENQEVPESTIVSLMNPVEAFLQRLDDLLADPEISAKTKVLKATRIQLIVGGEPVLMKKEGVQPLRLFLERSTQSDVFIRMSEEAAGVLATTSTLTEFKGAYKKMIGVTGEGSFVSIKFHTPLETLRAKGYFSIELLRILIDA